MDDGRGCATPNFDHYGGIYEIFPDQNETCFHFHTYDDDKFEGNEEFAIKLFSFDPLRFNNNESGVNESHQHPHPFDRAFHHSDFEDQHDDHNVSYSHHHHHHDQA